VIRVISKIVKLDAIRVISKIVKMKKAPAEIPEGIPTEALR